MNTKLLLTAFLCLTQFVAKAQCWQSVSSGGTHTLAIKTDGTLWAWGENSSGQLGLNDQNNRNFPTQIGKDNDWKQASAGLNHSSAIKTDGTLWTWGSNAYGQLAHGNTTDKLVPTKVVSTEVWSYTRAAYNVTYAINNRSILYKCGDKAVLGILYTSWDVLRTTSSKANDSNWQSVQAGSSHAIGLKKDGTIWAWGDNSLGQLGDGTTANTNPYFGYKKIGTESNWVAIASSYRHGMALKNDGSLWTWGDTSAGRMGIGVASNPSLKPIQIGNQNDWKSISGGGSTSFAIKNDGTLWAWGNNLFGMLGNGTQVNSYVPIQIETKTNWKLADGGRRHVMLLENDGTLKFIGNNVFGQLGDSSTTDKFAISKTVQCPQSQLSIDKINAQSEFKLFPNPVATSEIKIYTNGNCNFTIYTISGSIVQTGTLLAGENRVMLSSKMSNGIYQFKAGNSTQKLIINK